MKELFALTSKLVFTEYEAEPRIFTPYGISARCEGVGFAATDAIRHLKQIHSATIIDSETIQLGTGVIEGDGLYTTSPEVTIGVRTADCLPLLIADQKRRCAFALHAGWRGLAGGIVSNAVAVATKLGISASELVVAMAPCIGAQDFEVGPEVIAAFSDSHNGSSAEIALCTTKGNGDRWFFDLSLYAALQLLRAGFVAANIQIMRQSTVRSPGQLHSYRREGRGCQSNWSTIKITAQ